VVSGWGVYGAAQHATEPRCLPHNTAGWYQGNWSRVGGPLQWARNTGCVLPEQGCQAFTASPTPASEQLFCSLEATQVMGSQLANSVSASLRSVGPCRNVSFGNGCGLVYALGSSPTCANLQYQYRACSAACARAWLRKPYCLLLWACSQRRCIWLEAQQCVARIPCHVQVPSI
jgi:hypothetical protein